MSEIKDGGPAFPVEHYTQSRYESTGITLRDYFAAKAMQGILANPITDGERNDNTPEGIADMAYVMADAMIKAREE